MTWNVKTSKGTFIIGGIALVCFGVGMLLGHLVTPSSNSTDQNNVATTGEVVQIKPIDSKYEIIMKDKWNSEKDIIDKLISRIDPQRIKKYLRYLSEKPHLASSERDNELATYIRDKYREAGFDSAELVPYNLFLTKPDPNNPNKIKLIKNGATIFESNHKEVPINKDDDDPNFVHAFNAFTPAATVSTRPGLGVVYVNYGRVEDFDKLEEMGVNVSGNIAIVRYGKIYRGNKVQNAAQAGAIGIIIYSDPQEVAPEGIGSTDVYDNSWWLPGTGIQRGNTYIQGGDPLTPGWPSTEKAYRIPIEEADLHKIPCQPIGYADAKRILEILDGENVPSDWQGGIPGLQYKIGPTFKAEFRDVLVTLSTHNSGKIEKNYNVIGVIKGSIEPDRYVMIGNHRDAWGYGASDPSSGTAQLLETVRVYGTLLKEGWRPRRTLVFCSWGAEEYGLIGSREWVEEHVDKLQLRTVAYINTDTCTAGDELHINASPLLWNAFHYITAMIPGIKDESKTLFDEWKEYGDKFPKATETPIMKTLGSGSDFAPFTLIGGISCADISFKPNEVKYNISSYPYYHTGYETFYMVSTFVDPEFKIHQGCGRIASLALKYLSDSSIIPFSISRLPEVMLKGLQENKNRQQLMDIYDKYPELENAVNRFLVASKEFALKLKNYDRLKPLELRAINDQILKLERIFIIPQGLPGRPNIKHAVFAPSKFDKYASSGFPGLSDLLHKYDKLNESEKLSRNKEIKRHISDLTIIVDRATSLLKDVHLI